MHERIEDTSEIDSHEGHALAIIFRVSFEVLVDH